MQVFKAFFKIVRRRITSVIIYFVVFIGIAIAMGQMGQENETKSFKAEELKIAVDNRDQGTLGTALTKYLESSNRVLAVPDTNDELLDDIYSRNIEYVLYIPENFTDQFVSGSRENILREKIVPSSSSGEFASNQVESFLGTV